MIDINSIKYSIHSNRMITDDYKEEKCNSRLQYYINRSKFISSFDDVTLHLLKEIYRIGSY